MVNSPLSVSLCLCLSLSLSLCLSVSLTHSLTHSLCVCGAGQDAISAFFEGFEYQNAKVTVITLDSQSLCAPTATAKDGVLVCALSLRLRLSRSLALSLTACLCV